MTRQRYTFRESINRILRVFEGKAAPSDAPNSLTGEVLSADEALSDLTELLSGSLPSETFTMPSGANLDAYIAGVNDVLAGSSTSLFITPGVANSSDGYAEIYTHTGTVMMSLTGSQWSQITGSFQNSFAPTNGVIDAFPLEDRLSLDNQYGVYFVLYNLSYVGSPDVNYAFAVGVTGTAQISTYGASQPRSSGSATTVSGGGFFYVSGTSLNVDLRVYPGQNTFFRMLSGQLIAERKGAN